MIRWRQTLAGGLATAVCVFGLTGTADAGAVHTKRHDPRSDVTGQGVPAYAGRHAGDHPKLDRKLNDRSNAGGTGRTRAIVVLKPNCSIDGDLAKAGGRKGQKLGIISGQVIELPNGALRKLADNACVASIHWDRPLAGEMNRAAVTLGARAVQQQLGFDGAGVGVAIIDSGNTAWHDDLKYTGSNTAVKVVNGQRLQKFVDFVNGLVTPYDDNGHGTHVAGIIAGNGFDTLGARAGIAPAANLVSLKVLDRNGNGLISNVIAAMDWVVANQATYRIKVVNLSVGAAVSESYMTDPLTLAAKRVVDAGVVVVTAAGNLGKNRVTGKLQFGGITSPGNAPWVLTVGADSHNGTVSRTDDVMADYSSRGPTWMDFNAKPDVVAPGTGIVSLSVPGSMLYLTHPTYLLSGSLLSATKPYISLTGTSMAAPMVTGTVALMMQANPRLTPNLVKAIIEYTSQDYGYSSLVQGAGFLNTEGAVKLARYLQTATPGSLYPTNAAWSRTILWGNKKVTDGVIKPQGSAYATNVVWGSSSDGEGDNIVWGTHCHQAECDNIVWGTNEIEGANIVWGTFDREGDNIVWGTNDGEGDNIVWGTACGDGECDNIVWGTECGGADCGGVVWGSACNGAPGCQDLVWGTACDGDSECDNIVWGTACADGECDNIVWGTATDIENDNIVWGTSCSADQECDNIVWGSSTDEAAPIFDDPDSPSVFDNVPFESLFGSSTSVVLEAPAPPPAEPTSTTDNLGGGTF